jgi:hypothetical protein
VQDVEFLDTYADEHASTRSGVLQRAVALLRRQDLGAQYAAAFDEFETSGAAALWDGTAVDGIGPDEAW